MALEATIESVLHGAGVRGKLPAAVAKLPVAGLAYDSRRVGKNFLFFAFAGAHVDGAEFAAEALKKGAVAIVSEAQKPKGFEGPWIQVEHGRRALGSAASQFYDHPDERIRFTGITGTNGKTTTLYLTDSVLRAAGFKTAMIGTIEYRVAGVARNAVNTTPESLDVMQVAHELEEAGGNHLVMEVSSHALALERTHSIDFHTAVFTNLTRDHLDFHQTPEAYAAAKRLLFVPKEGEGPAWAILNADDPRSRQMIPTGSSTVLWYGFTSPASSENTNTLLAEKIRSGFDGLTFEMVWKGKKQPVRSALVGRMNVSNLLAAAGVGLSYGLDLETIARGLEACRSIPGRFERIDHGQPFLVVVDFAHTEDALRNVLGVARELASARSGRVITLFGCGGDRDRTKRPLMGSTAGELSDFVVLTSDNPRSEDPIGILNDVMVGLGRHDTAHIVEPDRATAIRRAFAEARPADVVILAGKGHETYQILKDRTLDFDDRVTARAALESLGYTPKKDAHETRQ